MDSHSHNKIAFLKIVCLFLLCGLPLPVWVHCSARRSTPLQPNDSTTAVFSDTAYFEQFYNIFYDTLEPSHNAFISRITSAGDTFHPYFSCKDTISWSLIHGTPDLPDDEETRLIGNALKSWSTVVPVRFVHIPFNGDINFQWNDCSSPSDARAVTNASRSSAGCIAHASTFFFEQRFCGTPWVEEEDWSQKGALYITALHESAHALGLNDVRSTDGTRVLDPDYVPFPPYNYSVMDFAGRGTIKFLTDYDCALVQHAYGAPDYLPLILMYINADSTGRAWHDYYTCTSWNVANKIFQSACFDDSTILITLLGTIARKALPGTIPLYRYWYSGSQSSSGHLDTLAQCSDPRWHADGITGYLYTATDPDRCAVYEYYNPVKGGHRMALDTNFDSEGYTTRTLLGYIDCTLKWE